MEYLKIHEDCKFVKGYRRSIILDLGREKFHYIPNILFEIVDKFDKKNINEIYSYYGKKNINKINEYLSFLIENNFGLICSKNQSEIFKSINLNWINFSKITNAIIEINNNFDFKKIIIQLENLGCYHIQLRSEFVVEYTNLIKILQSFENIAIKSVDVIIKYNNDIDLYKNLVLKYNRLKSIIFHSAPKNLRLQDYSFITLLEKKLENPNDYITINPYLFRVNLPTFLESINHNLYFNKKISIDFRGNIKNCLNSKKIFGNIERHEIENIIQKKDFKKYWNISKTKIEICKDCEYRNICIDARIPLKDENGIWNFESQCPYDPYNAKWNT